MIVPKLRFNKYNWTKDCYKPSFNKYWSGKIWDFSFYKYGIIIDFRSDTTLISLLNSKESKSFILRLKLLLRRN